MSVIKVRSTNPSILQNQTAIATDNLAQQEIEESIEIVYNYLSACLIDAPRPILENLIKSLRCVDCICSKVSRLQKWQKFSKKLEILEGVSIRVSQTLMQQGFQK
jgi:hypothetical protein